MKRKDTWKSAYIHHLHRILCSLKHYSYGQRKCEIHKYIHTYIQYTHKHMYTHMHTHICTHTHTYIYIYTHMYTLHLNFGEQQWARYLSCRSSPGRCPSWWGVWTTRRAIYCLSGLPSGGTSTAAHRVSHPDLSLRTSPRDGEVTRSTPMRYDK